MKNICIHPSCYTPTKVESSLCSKHFEERYKPEPLEYVKAKQFESCGDIQRILKDHEVQIANLSQQVSDLKAALGGRRAAVAATRQKLNT